MRPRVRTSRSPPACSNTRSTRGRPSSGAGRCRRCCGPATTPASPGGAGPRRCAARSNVDPSCWTVGHSPRPTRRCCVSSPTKGMPASMRAPDWELAMNATDLVDRAQLRDDIPDFAPGDTLRVHVRVVEGNRQRLQVFQGVVIRRKGSGVRETFTVRKVSFGVGVERTFPVHSPIVAKIEVVTRGDVRRAKLYYLRDRTGKAAKIKEKRAAR